MAASDVKVPISVSVSGVEAIQQLATQMRTLAAEGGNAAPQYREFANELDRVAKQAATLDEIGALQADVLQLSEAFEQAKANVSEYRTQLAALEGSAKGAKIEQQAANEQWRDARNAVGEIEGKLKLYRAGVDSSTAQTTEYRVGLRQLTEQLVAAKAQVREKATALEASKKASTAAAEAVRTYKKENEGVEQSLARANRALEQRRSALDNTSDALRKSGVETIDLSAAQDQLRASLEKTTSEIVATGKAAEAAAADQQRLKDIATAVGQSNEAELARARRIEQQREIIAERTAEAEVRAAARTEAASRSAFDAIVAGSTRAGDAQRDLIAKTEAAARAFDESWAKVGVRSANVIQAEIRETDAALVRLASNTKVSGREFARAFEAGQTKIAGLRRELEGVPDVVNKTGGAIGFLKGQVAQLVALYSGVELGRQFFQANIELQTLQRSLTATVGSSQAAAKQIDFLRNVANTAGLSVGELSTDFVRFNASMRAAGIDAQTVNNTFDLVANAAGRLGLSTQRTGLILTALGQIANKGKVSLEELQGQLGESLPGALKITADGLGITTDRLLQLVSTGGVTSREFFTAFQRGLEGLNVGTATVEGLAAAWNRLKNALTQASQQAGDSTAFKALVSVLDGIAGNLNRVVDGAFGLAKAFAAIKIVEAARNFLGLKQAAVDSALAQERAALAARAQTAALEANTVAANANTVAARNNAAANAAQATAATAAAAASAGATRNATAWTALAAGLQGTGAAAGQAATKLAAVAPAAANTNIALRALQGGASLAASGFRSLLGFIGGIPGLALIALFNIRELGEGLAGWAARVTGLTDAEKKLEEQLAKEAAAAKEAARAAGEKAAADEKAIRAVVERFEKESQAASVQVDVTKKLAEARKIEAEATNDIIRLSGDEQAARAQAAFSANSVADALRSNTVARENEIRILREQLAAIEQEIRVTGSSNKAKDEKITKIKEALALAEAELEKSRQTTQAAETEAASLKLVALAYQDNSAQLEQWRDELDRARTSLQAVRQLQEQGLATQELVRKATLDLSIAEAKYKDALDDTNKRIQERISLNSAQGSLRGAELNLQKQQYENEAKIADALGNTVLATYNKVRAREVEAAQTRDKAAVDERNARLELESIDRQRRAIEQTRQLTAEEETNFKLRELNAKQKLVEAKASRDAADAIDRETAAMQANNAAKQQSINLSQSLIDRNRQLTEELAASDAARNQRNAAGAAAQGGDAFFELQRKAREGTLTQSDLGLAQTVFESARVNLTTAQRNMTAFSPEGFRSEQARYVEARRILEMLQASALSGGGGGTAPSTSVVNVNINGRTTPVKVASPQDANTLAGLFQQLSLDATRGG